MYRIFHIFLSSKEIVKNLNSIHMKYRANTIKRRIIMAWNSYDVAGSPGNGMWGGGGLGGTALAAGAGALIGGLLFGNGGLGGANVSKDVAVETAKGTSDLQAAMLTTALAASDRGYQQTIGFNQQMNTVDRDVLATSYETSRQMCDGFYAGNTTALQGKYETALQLAAMGYQQEKCCCETNENIMKMGYETQLRDQSNYGTIMAEILKTQCIVKDVEKDSIMREQAARIYALEGRLNKEEIITAMKPVSPVPAYIQANPYENFRPVVRVEHDREFRDCDDRWGFNNNCCGHRGGFQ